MAEQHQQSWAKPGVGETAGEGTMAMAGTPHPTPDRQGRMAAGGWAPATRARTRGAQGRASGGEIGVGEARERWIRPAEDISGRAVAALQRRRGRRGSIQAAAGGGSGGRGSGNALAGRIRPAATIPGRGGASSTGPPAAAQRWLAGRCLPSGGGWGFPVSPEAGDGGRGASYFDVACRTAQT
nr:translation initiation factor IF-2-like [Aegilops tauschii subsp. strangulata]